MEIVKKIQKERKKNKENVTQKEKMAKIEMKHLGNKKKELK